MIEVVKYFCFTYIRIEPDWNVKAFIAASVAFPLMIRIEPDWNVK